VGQGGGGVDRNELLAWQLAKKTLGGDSRGEIRKPEADFLNRKQPVAKARWGMNRGRFGHFFVLSVTPPEVIQDWKTGNTVDYDFKFSDDGLIPVIVQEASGADRPAGRVLMFAWMNRESLALTLERGLMTYWSRSRKKLWLKGESSGHTQRVVRWYVDCDKDVLLFEVEQETGACHTGYESCFFQELDREANPLPVRETKMFDDAAVYCPAPASKG
jgi:phosphoribosyl-AMP cyclohydrolase